MNNERILKDQLHARVAELYGNGRLDTGKPDHDRLTRHYDDASLDIVETLRLKERREWSSYGCGSASFLESWFYLPQKEYEVRHDGMEGVGYRGVLVIFSLLEPMFAAGEATKSWSERNDSGMLPSLEMIDEYSSESVRTLGLQICTHLRRLGIPQASRYTLSDPLDSSVSIESNMAFGELTLFDAFYHWAD